MYNIYWIKYLYNVSFQFQHILQKKICLNNLFYTQDFAEVSKNFARYRSENNFVEPSKLYKHLNVDDKAAKSFNILAVNFERP